MAGKSRPDQDNAAMTRFRADLVFYFDAKDLDSVPRRLRELAAAAETAGFDFGGGKAEPASEAARPEDGWTRFAPLSDAPD
jgi:hypothetical protein